MKLLDTFHGLVGEKICGINDFFIHQPNSSFDFRFHVVVTEEKSVLFFNILKTDSYTDLFESVHASSYERFRFLKLDKVSHFLQACGITSVEIATYLRESQTLNNDTSRRLAEIEDEIQELKHEAAKLKDDWR